MRILTIAQRFHTNLYYRVKALESAGHHVRVVALYKGASEFYDGIDYGLLGYSSASKLIMRLFPKRKKMYLKSNIELRMGFPKIGLINSIIRQFRPDVILLKSYQDMLALSVLLAAKLNNIKIIMLVQSSKNHIKGSTNLLKIYIRFLKLFNVRHLASPLLLTENIFNKLGMPCTYIPFTFDAPLARKRLPDDSLRIISVGKLVRRKGHLLLLRAFKSLADKYKIKLTLVAEKADVKYEKMLRDYIIKNNLSHLVTIKCNLDYESVLKEYENNDLFVLPSYREPAAYSIVEAMAFGLPVICSDECGTKCYVEEGKNGYVFKARDFDSIKDKLELIIKDRPTLRSLSERSYKMACKNHSFHAFNTKFNRIIGDLG